MIELGQKVKDRITGFKGIAVAKIEYLNGCIRYQIQPKKDKEGKIPESEWIDEQQLEKKEKKEKNGGPGKTPSGFSVPQI